MAERRRAKSGQPKGPVRWRRIGAAALVVVAVGAVGWSGYLLTDPATLPVKTVRVGGELVHLGREQLRQTVSPFAQAGLLRVDIDEVRGAVRALPWVDRAEVRRAWPDTLEIRITEQQAVARWADEALVNSRGELFRPQREQWPGGLPELAGPQRNAAVIASRFSQLRNLFAPLGLEPTALVQDDRRSWRVRLGNGVEVLLGRKRSAERLLRFVRLYPRVLAARAGDIKRVDLRYTNGFAVAWRKRGAAAGA